MIKDTFNRFPTPEEWNRICHRILPGAETGLSASLNITVNSQLSRKDWLENPGTQLTATQVQTKVLAIEYTWQNSDRTASFIIGQDVLPRPRDPWTRPLYYVYNSIRGREPYPHAAESSTLLA
jgi:hypothetical protein